MKKRDESQGGWAGVVRRCLVSVTLVGAAAIPCQGAHRVPAELPDHREITDAAAGEKVRQRFAAPKTLEQGDRAKAARLRVIRRTSVQMGDHRLIRNQVVPPALAPAAPSPIPPASGDTARWEWPAAKPIRMLTLSATVYDRRITHLRWDHGGQNYTGWSNIDFNYLRGVTEFETADAHYFVLMGLGDMTSQEFTAINRIMDEAGLTDYDPKQIPGVSVFTPGETAYFMEDFPPGRLAPTAVAPLDALHAFYKKNAAQLRTDHRNTEKLHAARERHEAARPAPPRNEMLNFWMILPPEAGR